MTDKNKDQNKGNGQGPQAAPSTEGEQANPKKLFLFKRDSEPEKGGSPGI